MNDKLSVPQIFIEFVREKEDTNDENNLKHCLSLVKDLLSTIVFLMQRLRESAWVPVYYTVQSFPSPKELKSFKNKKWNGGGLIISIPLSMSIL